jgi:hypothetical protein
MQAAHFAYTAIKEAPVAGEMGHGALLGRGLLGVSGRHLGAFPARCLLEGRRAIRQHAYG